MKNKPLFILCGILLSSSVLAEDLSAVFDLAQANDPTFQASRQTQLAEQEAKPQAQADFFPVLSATSQHTAYHNTNNSQGNAASNRINYNQSNYGLTLSQPIFYYQQWVNLSKASNQVKAANATFAAAEQDLIVRTVESYFNVLKAFDALKFAKAQQKAFAKFYEQTEERYKVGLIAITDVQIAKAKHDNAYAQVISAENELSDQKEKLAEITGQPIKQFSSLRKKLKLIPPEPADMTKWVETALDQNFSLQAAQYTSDAAKAEVRIQQGGHMPTVNINGNVNRQTSTPFSAKGTTSNIGLQVTMPIFSGGSITSKTRQAMHLYEKNQRDVETLHRQVKSNTRQAYRGVLTQISQAKALKQAIVSNASALEATEASFTVGTRTIVDVLDSQTNLIQAEQDYANARYDYILQTLRLKQAAGTLCPEDIKHINSWLAGNKVK